MSRRPDYKLGFLNKATDEKGNVGAAWLNEDSTITIVLNTQVQITGSADVILTLFPNKKPKHDLSTS